MPDIVAALVGVGFLVLWIYCIYDVISTDEVLVRNLPKLMWLMIVIVIPDIGSLLWLGLGRPQVWARQAHDPQRYGTGRPGRSVPVAPKEASLEHLSPIVQFREEQSRLRLREEQLKRREEAFRLRELGEGSP